MCSGNGQVSPLKASVFQCFCSLLLKMTIRCQSGLLTFGQGYLIFGIGRPQNYGQILMSLQHWLSFIWKTVSTIHFQRTEIVIFSGFNLCMGGAHGGRRGCLEFYFRPELKEVQRSIMIVLLNVSAEYILT